MNYKELIKFSSDLQLQADELAYEFLELQNLFGLLSVCQSICDFNLSFYYKCGPEVFIHTESLEFLSKHLNMFKRKLTVKEMFQYDSLIYWNKPENFNQFKKLLI